MLLMPYHRVCPASFFIPLKGLEILGLLPSRIFPAGNDRTKVVVRQAKNEFRRIANNIFKTIATLLGLAVSLSAKFTVMKKIFLSLLVALAFDNVVSAQAYEGTIEYDKKKQEAFMIDYPYPPEAVQNAITKRMAKLGYKAKEEKGLFNKDKGFMIFKDAFVTDINADRMDYIIKVDAKSRKSQDESVVYMIIQKDGNNAKSAFDVMQVEKTKTFLSSLQPDVVAESLELDIKAQEEAVSKAEKKLRGLKDDQNDLEKKLKDNQSAQKDTEKEIEAKKQALDALKAKRIVDKT